MSGYFANSVRWDSATLLIVHGWWTARRTTLLHVAVTLMGAVALLTLGNGFWHLVWGSSPTDAIDLKFYHRWVDKWFAGQTVYSGRAPAVYPPASYVLLWPGFGWLSVAGTRWFWAATTVAALGWLVYLVIHESGADTALERLFVGLMPLSMNATGVTIGNGQLIVHLLPALVAGLLLLHRGRGRWNEDLLASILLLGALVKPSVSLPFIWLAFFLPGRLRPAALITIGYIALTWFAGSFQEETVPSLIRATLAHGSAAAAREGYASLHSWLVMLHLQEWILPASALALFALGVWVHRHRDDDVWITLGVTALVARFWTWHRSYDGLLILLPMVALFRIAKRAPSIGGAEVVAGALLAVTIVAMAIPARIHLLEADVTGLSWLEISARSVFASAYAVIWIAILVFLLDRARRSRHRHAATV